MELTSQNNACARTVASVYPLSLSVNLKSNYTRSRTRAIRSYAIPRNSRHTSTVRGPIAEPRPWNPQYLHYDTSTTTLQSYCLRWEYNAVAVRCHSPTLFATISKRRFPWCHFVRIICIYNVMVKTGSFFSFFSNTWIRNLYVDKTAQAPIKIATEFNLLDFLDNFGLDSISLSTCRL